MCVYIYIYMYIYIYTHVFSCFVFSCLIVLEAPGKAVCVSQGFPQPSSPLAASAKGWNLAGRAHTGTIV